MRHQLLCRQLIGRQDELDRLISLVETSGTAIVAGEPGVGKTRLVRELVRTLQGHGTVVLTGRAVHTGAPLPYRPLSEAVLSGCRLRGLPASTELHPYRAALGQLIPEWHHPELTASAGSAVMIGEGVLRLLRTMDSGAGVVLVLEDLHWADPESLAVLEYLADHGRETGLGCVVTARTGPSPSTHAMDTLVARRAAVRITLSPLHTEEASLVARHCLGTETLPDGLIDLVDRAEGVPFLIEELLAAAEDSGALASNGGSWSFQPGSAAIVPRTLADSITQRTNSLNSDDRDVLRVAALLGRHIDPILVGHAQQITDEAASGVLDRCVALQLISLEPSGGYRFRHALTREAVLAGTPASACATLAQHCLKALEHLHPSLSGRWCQTAAELSLAAGDVTGSANLLFTLGRQAFGQGALATATTALERARSLVPDLSDLALNIDELRTEVAASAGDVGAAEAIGANLLRPGSDPKRRARVRLLLAQAMGAAEQWAAAEEHLRQVDPSDASMRAKVDALAAHIKLGDQRLTEAEETARRALTTAERLDLPEPACQALEVLGRIARIRDLATAEQAFTRQLEIATRHSLGVWRIRASHELGTIDLVARNGNERLGQARDMAATAGALATVATLDLQLAAAALMAFDATACLEATARCQQAARRFTLHSALAAALMYESRAHALAGDRPAMERAIADALLVSPHEPSIESEAWVSRATLRLMRDDPAQALVAFRKAISIERQSASVGLGPHWGLSILLQTVREDEAETARDELRRTVPSGVCLNEALLAYADSVAAGSRGNTETAEETFTAARSRIDTVRGGRTWRHLAERLVAEVALRDGWGCPAEWLTDAAEFFRGTERAELERACRSLLRQSGAKVPHRVRPGRVPAKLAAVGVTEREAEVLALVLEGLTSREIAARLYLSPRTVDKHIERLIAKTGVQGRLQLRSWMTT